MVSQDADPVARRRSLTNSALDASISTISVSPYTSQSSTVFLGLTNGKLLKVENAHSEPADAVWTELTGSQFLGSISDVEFGESENELYVTFYNYGVRSIWYTANANAANPTWVNKEGNLPDLPVLTILPNPLNPKEVIIGTELGIWVTENFDSNSPSWEQSYNGMSDVKVTDLDLKKGNNVVYAASYGRGMYSGQFKTAAEEAEERGEMVVEENRIQVYPTVSEGTYNIISGEDVLNAEIFIYNIQGKLVKVLVTPLEANQPVELDLQLEASGLYIFRMTGAGTTNVQKVLKAVDIKDF